MSDYEKYLQRQYVLRPADTLDRPIVNGHIEVLQWPYAVRLTPRQARMLAAHLSMLADEAEERA